MKKICIFSILAPALLVVGSCAREMEDDVLYTPIRFSAEAGEGSEAEFAETRTSYGTVSSGKRTMTWTSGDRISIYAPQASATSGSTAVSYTVNTSASSSGVSPVNSSIHLLWGDASTHHFYGKYPDPSWSGSAPYANSSFKNQTKESTSFTCYLPASVSITPSSGKYSYTEDMTYCYMTAYATAAQGAGSISLGFAPAVSAFRFTIPHAYVGGNFSVSSVTLSSASHRLNGTYTVDVASSTPSVSESSLSDADKSVTVNFSSPVTVPSGSSLEVTLFTCPVTANDLTLTITASDGVAQKLPLKTSGGSWISFPSGNFFTITCGTVPDPYIYQISLSGDAVGQGAGTVANPYTLSIASNGSSKSTSITVNSVKAKPGMSTWSASSWAVEYSLDGSTWSSTSPLSGFSVSGSGTTATVTMPAGTQTDMDHFTFRSARGTSGSPFDLSYYDGVTDQTKSSRSTANSYIVRGPGYYRIPVVYGNAIKNSDVNPGAYKNTGGTLQNFVNHDDVAIEEPWITDNTAIHEVYSGGCADFCNFTILWQDCPEDVITDIDCVIVGDHEYVDFRVTDAIKPCNAVIQAKHFENGKVFWSWHIWIVPDELGLTYTPVTNHDGRTVNMLTANVGQLPAFHKGYPAQDMYVRFKTADDASKPAMAVLKVTRPEYVSSASYQVSPQYQRGRKDPMITANPFGTGDRPAGTYKGSGFSTQSKGTIGQSIQNPGKFFTSGDSQWWSGTDYRNLWDATLSSYVSDNASSVKTVYDPCPAGYKVARGKDFSGFTKSGGSSSLANSNIIGEWQKGFYFARYDGDTEGIFFPQTGQRWYYSGSLSDVSYTGQYATSASSRGGEFGFHSEVDPYVDPTRNNYSSYGYAVRCIVE